MKILYHHRIRSKDGQYVHIEELVDALQKAGHEVHMVGPRAVETEGFGSESRSLNLLKHHLPKFLYETMEFCYCFYDYVLLSRAIRRFQPDCIYERYNLFLPSGVWASKRFDLPLLLEVNAPLLDERDKYHGISLKKLAAWTERKAWCGADYVLPVTRVLADMVKRTGVTEDRIAVIPNGINLDRFDGAPEPEAQKSRLGLQGKTVLGFVGFMREWHGLDKLLQALQETDESVHLLLVGDGPARALIERSAAELGVAHRVTITGVINRESVRDYIAAFDVALQPDVVRYASPLKLFEYLAMGRAIVAPATPNIQEILEDGDNAVLFDVDSAEQFKDAVKRVCSDAALRARLGEAARRTIEQRGLTWTGNAQRVTQLFETLVHGQYAVNVSQ